MKPGFEKGSKENSEQASKNIQIIKFEVFAQKMTMNERSITHGLICSSQTVKYYNEMNIYYLIVKFTTNMAVNSMFKSKNLI